MYKYYMDALQHTYDAENPRSWKTTCLYCNVSSNVSVRLRCFCHMKCHCFSTVVAPLPIMYLFIIHCSETGEANKIKINSRIE